MNYKFARQFIIRTFFLKINKKIIFDLKVLFRSKLLSIVNSQKRKSLNFTEQFKGLSVCFVICFSSYFFLVVFNNAQTIKFITKFKHKYYSTLLFY